MASEQGIDLERSATANQAKQRKQKRAAEGIQEVDEIEENSLISPSQEGDSRTQSTSGNRQNIIIDEEQIQAMNARRRVMGWTNGCLGDQDLVKALKTGIYGTRNVNHHQFRSTEADKFRSPLPIIPRQ